MNKFLKYILLIITAIIGLICLLIIGDEMYRYFNSEFEIINKTLAIPALIAIFSFPCIVFQLRALKITQVDDYNNLTDESQAILDDVLIENKSTIIPSVLWISNLIFGLINIGIGSYLLYITHRDSIGDPIQNLIKYAVSVGFILFGIGILFNAWKTRRNQSYSAA